MSSYVTYIIIINLLYTQRIYILYIGVTVMGTEWDGHIAYHVVKRVGCVSSR